MSFLKNKRIPTLWPRRFSLFRQTTKQNSLLASSSLPIKPPVWKRLEPNSTMLRWWFSRLSRWNVNRALDRHAPVCLCGCVCVWAFSRERRRRRRGGSLKGIDRWQRSGTQSRWPTISLYSWPQRRSRNTTMSLPMFGHFLSCLLLSSFATRPSFTKRNGQVLNDKWWLDWFSRVKHKPHLLKYVSVAALDGHSAGHQIQKLGPRQQYEWKRQPIKPDVSVCVCVRARRVTFKPSMLDSTTIVFQLSQQGMRHLYLETSTQWQFFLLSVNNSMAILLVASRMQFAGH